MSDAQVAGLLRDEGVPISTRRLRRWRQEGLLEQPAKAVSREGGAGRSSLRYDDGQLRRVLPVARELTALRYGMSTSESLVLLFVRGRSVSAVRLVQAVKEQAASLGEPELMRTAAAVTVDDLLDARACLYGLPDLRTTDAGSPDVAPQDFADGTGATRALLTAVRERHPRGLAHQLWDAWLRNPREPADDAVDLVMTPVW